VLKLLVVLVATGIAVLTFVFVRRRESRGTKITDKRARAEVFKQLLALSDDTVQQDISASSSKSTAKALPPQPHAAALVTRQQRRAEQRKARKLAFAKSQRA